MNFFGIGPMEAALVTIIAVIVLGPERFPQAAVQVARAIKFLRGYATDATSQLRTEFQELTREYEQLRGELAEVRGSMTKDVSRLADEMTRTVAEAKAKAKMPSLEDVLDTTKPIIEPGGELPPDNKGANGAAGG
jgi:sec-independent protein translocase protein TatB